ncbi:MAG: hydrocarbon degradation protein [Blastopirellula sp.]|nr:hydrocarbon degradation protein [Blastopirellula sp.]
MGTWLAKLRRGLRNPWNCFCSEGRDVMFRSAGVLFVFLALFLSSNHLLAQGIIIPWGGPVNAGMGGAATAAPVDAIGATYWNPATTSALTNELSVGLGFLVPLPETHSSIAGIASGSTESDSGATALPSVGFVHRREGSRTTFSLSIAPVAGFGTNYPASGTNPFFLPQSNAPAVPGGFGAMFTRANFLQLAPSLTFALTDKLSFAVGPTVTMGEIVVDPLVLGPMNDADGSGQPRYGPGRGTRYGWGGGGQVGVFFIGDNGWNLGASIKTPQWMEPFSVNSTDENGLPLVAQFKADLPMIVSVGTAYRGFENLVFALDVRYFDYKNTDGLGDSGFAATGALQGLGMSSVMSVATGAQWHVSECLYLRAGYSFNQSPFQDSDATFAVAAPLHYQHVMNVGCSFALSKSAWINAVYSYAPEASLTGPIMTPLGPAPGTSVTTDVQIHAAQLGVTVKY